MGLILSGFDWTATYVSAAVNDREPIYLAAGDTLSFQRFFPDYLPQNGWSLTYEIRGGGQAIEFSSSADETGHVVTVAESVTAEWTPGNVTLAGYAVNAGASERHQIYLAPLTIGTDLQTAAADDDTQTLAQKMIATLGDVILKKAGGDLLESQFGETRFKFMTMVEMRTELAYWKEMRRNEIALARARNGMPNGMTTLPVMNFAGRGCGNFRGGWPLGGWR